MKFIKITGLSLKYLYSISQVEINVQKSNNDLHKSNEKDPLVEVVKKYIRKLPKGTKTP